MSVVVPLAFLTLEHADGQDHIQGHQPRHQGPDNEQHDFTHWSQPTLHLRVAHWLEPRYERHS